MIARCFACLAIVLVGLSASLIDAAPIQQNQTWFVGGWRGRITQPGAGSYDGVFSLKSASIGEVFGTSSYVELACGGYLTLLSASETTLEFQETLTYGLSRCINGVKKILTVRPDMLLDYEIAPNQFGTATAILTPASNDALPAYLGTWRGVITQGGAQRYAGIFTFRAGNVGDRLGTSYYVELGCGGELTLLSVTATSLEIQEQITFGRGCGSGYRKTLTFVSSNALDYSIVPGQGFSATARLNRAYFVYLPMTRR
jgi:hypothetical protein